MFGKSRAAPYAAYLLNTASKAKGNGAEATASGPERKKHRYPQQRLLKTVVVQQQSQTATARSRLGPAGDARSDPDPDPDPGEQNAGSQNACSLWWCTHAGVHATTPLCRHW